MLSLQVAYLKAVSVAWVDVMVVQWLGVYVVVHPQPLKIQLELLFSPSQLQTCWSSRNRSSRSFCRTAGGEHRRSKRRCLKAQLGPDLGHRRRRPHWVGMGWHPWKQLLRSPRPPKAPQLPTPPPWAEASVRGKTSSSLRTARHQSPPPALSAYQPPSWLLWRSWKPKGWGLKRKTPTLWRGRGVTILRSTPGWRRISPHPTVHTLHMLSVIHRSISWFYFYICGLFVFSAAQHKP